LSAALKLLWREGVTAAVNGDGALVVQGLGGKVSLPGASPALVDVFRRFDPPGVEENQIVDLVHHAANGSLARWCYYLEQLSRRGLLCRCAHSNGTRLATLVAVSSWFVPKKGTVDAKQRYVLSRFVYIRREGDKAVVESPLAHARVILDDCRAAAVMVALSTSATLEELGARTSDLPVNAVCGVMTLLFRANMLAEVDQKGICAEDNNDALQTWAFHDLLFHARSRGGRFDAPHGATYRLAGRVAAPSALKPRFSGQSRQLYRPDLATLERSDPPFAWVQENRNSVREFDSRHPVTEQQLGEFLFRVARVKEYRQEEVETPGGSVQMDFASRPYPAGGALYELEEYLAVNQCADLEAGLYHYEASGHTLIQIGHKTSEVANLLRDAAASTAIPEDELQVLLILAARVPRIAWKYESIAYALTLKHVGVLFQTMYLAATAMGLGGCAVGGGDSDVFGRAAGTEYTAESSVGEFILGSRRLEPAVPGR
jgi:SagB-type dehydrogenase family enzyme